MPTTKIFQVNLTVPDWDADKLNQGFVADMLRAEAALDHHEISWMDVESVHRINPENTARLSKIGAIKRVRDLLPGTSLLDAKFLVDTAETKGTARWSHIQIVRQDDSREFCVIDNS